MLVFGGDQVYPTASKEDYEAKLQAPFEDANMRETGDRRLIQRFLFALPGNHDWYDDLTAFTHLFSNRHRARVGSAQSPGRIVCGRHTRQTRSYFALKLPHKWWLCAWDVQLDSFIDQTQISFFEYVAQPIIEPGSNIIVYVGQPVWAYCRDEVIPEFWNFAFASLIVSGYFPRLDDPAATRHHNVRLVLTGDTHNYSHFIERGTEPNVVVHYLASGQGGAFLHPTHWLEDTKVEVRWQAAQPLTQIPTGTAPDGTSLYTREFKIEKDRTGQESPNAVFPDKKTSAHLAWRNLRFAAINPQFAVFVFFLVLFAGWLLHHGGLVLHTTLAELRNLTFSQAASALFRLPWPALMIFGIGAAFVYFADHKKWSRRLPIGAAHALAHILTFLIVLFVLASHLPGSLSTDFWIVVLTAVLCGLINTTILGAYLLVSLHWNEAFSSLRIEDYKGFLRLKIDPQGNLTVYPIVIERVPHAEDGAVLPRLVEKPIQLPAIP